MRYAVFTDIHANLEALEAILAKIDEIAEKNPIDQIWFLGDLVGYGPDPNECILKLRERTDVIIAGNHDWAAVAKIDLEDFSAAARISAEWTAEQLTEEHRNFLSNLPERLEIGECTLVHGSPYGPLWEYLTSEVLAERSFQYFSSRYCFVGHTHVPAIFQQPDAIANTPTLPLANTEQIDAPLSSSNGTEAPLDDAEVEAGETVKVHPPTPPAATHSSSAAEAESAYAEPETGRPVTEEVANAIIESRQTQESHPPTTLQANDEMAVNEDEVSKKPVDAGSEDRSSSENSTQDIIQEDLMQIEPGPSDIEEEENDAAGVETGPDGLSIQISDESIILNAEDRLSSEIEELLALLGLSQSMVQVTNEMSMPPEGHWEAKEGYRAIVNPGGVGQPRDGDPRAAFMIFDTEHGFEFYRVPYSIEKTQEKIIKAGLPQYLAVRLAFGR